LTTVDELVRFGRALRDAGLTVEARRLHAFRDGLALLGDDRRYWAGRTTLVSRRDELPVYDRVYERFFDRVPEDAPPAGRPVQHRSAAALALRADVGATVTAPAAGLASRAEAIRRKSFADCTAEELADVQRLLARLRLTAPVRRTRRRGAARRGEPDVRRTLRRALRTAGEPLELARRARRPRRRRIVFLLDVSGSMSAYARALIVLAHSAVRADQRFEAFAFGTRLTRLTRPLDTPRLELALRRAARAADDWEGGTRIGQSLKAFLARFGHAGLARGAVVVICSDGLEVGEPELLAEQMARLHRLAHRVVWLNPLKESPEYAPLARGMAAALPFVDVFAGGHNLESLEEVVETVARAAGDGLSSRDL
jgi:uncharacterized protein